MAARSTFVWGLQRSGIHLLTGWLYANHGGVRRDPLAGDDLHPQLRDGFRDPDAGIAFFNNPGRFHCRTFALGDVWPADFEAAAHRAGRAIFSIEDCDLARADQLPRGEGTATILVLRHPLNLVASRLRGAIGQPELFRVDEPFVDLLASYCAEALRHTRHLPDATVVSYDRFVAERSHRDAIAAHLGLPNLDEVSEVSAYGGGSSFSDRSAAPAAEVVRSRYLEHPVPGELLGLLRERPAIVEASEAVFGFDLAAVG